MARIALVTGGGSGIGRAICQTLARDNHVIVTDVDATSAAACQKDIEAAGGSAESMVMDVTSTESVRNTMDTFLQSQSLDVLVNCAGWDKLMPFTDTDEAFWDRIIDLNFKGVLRTTHVVLPHMIERGGGHIVNISSDAGRVGSSLEAVYAGAKGGIIAFTKTIAREVARYGISANCVCPGPTETPLLDEIAAASDDGERVLGSLAKGVPMKRLGTPQDVATAVRFFANEESGFITGQTLSVSGGLTMA